MIDHKNILEKILPIPQGYRLLKIVNNQATYIKQDDPRTTKSARSENSRQARRQLKKKTRSLMMRVQFVQI